MANSKAYLIRGIEPDVLERAHARARAGHTPLGTVLRNLLTAYADGKAWPAELGRRGGLARAQGQTPEQRRALAQQAAAARWAKRKRRPPRSGGRDTLGSRS